MDDLLSMDKLTTSAIKNQKVAAKEKEIEEKQAARRPVGRPRKEQLPEGLPNESERKQNLGVLSKVNNWFSGDPKKREQKEVEKEKQRRIKKFRRIKRYFDEFGDTKLVDFKPRPGLSTNVDEEVLDAEISDIQAHIGSKESIKQARSYMRGVAVATEYIHEIKPEVGMVTGMVNHRGFSQFMGSDDVLDTVHDELIEITIMHEDWFFKSHWARLLQKYVNLMRVYNGLNSVSAANLNPEEVKEKYKDI